MGAFLFVGQFLCNFQHETPLAQIKEKRMKTKLISLLLPIFMFVSCEDKVEEASACVSIIANAEQTIEAASNEFDAKIEAGTATKADCDKLIATMQEIVDCMPEGAEKTEMQDDITQASATCSAFPS